jgi:PUA domain protein
MNEWRRTMLFRWYFFRFLNLNFELFEILPELILTKMFKKIEDLSKPLLLNKSATKDIRQHAIESFPSFELIADDVLPKKGQLVSYRLRSEHKTDIVTLDNDVLFFNKEQLIVPHLRLVHQYPDLLPRMQIDKGGLKHIYDGSNVMCPGLTSPGGILADVRSFSL